MDQQQIVASFEARAKSLGLPIAALCAGAGIAASTFSRWKRSARNPKPVGMSFASMSAIERVLADREGVAIDHAVTDRAKGGRPSTGKIDEKSGQVAA